MFFSNHVVLEIQLKCTGKYDVGDLLQNNLAVGKVWLMRVEAM